MRYHCELIDDGEFHRHSKFSRISCGLNSLGKGKATTPVPFSRLVSYVTHIAMGLCNGSYIGCPIYEAWFVLLCDPRVLIIRFQDSRRTWKQPKVHVHSVATLTYRS